MKQKTLKIQHKIADPVSGTVVMRWVFKVADIRNHVDESAQLPKVQGLPRNLVSQLLTGARLSHRGAERAVAVR